MVVVLTPKTGVTSRLSPATAYLVAFLEAVELAADGKCRHHRLRRGQESGAREGGGVLPRDVEQGGRQAQRTAHADGEQKHSGGRRQHRHHAAGEGRYGTLPVASFGTRKCMCTHTYGAGVPTGLGRPSSVAPHTQTHTQLPKPKVPSSHRQTQMQSLAIMRSESTSFALAVLASMALL